MVDFDKLNKLSQIKRVIRHKHEKTGGHCGVTVPEIRMLTGIESESIKKCLNILYVRNEITVHKGKDGKMVKYNPNL